jgi:hypothetical protein
MRTITVRWTAVYETVIKVPDKATLTHIKDAAAGIRIDVPGSEYQTDTWEVESLEENGKKL